MVSEASFEISESFQIRILLLGELIRLIYSMKVSAQFTIQIQVDAGAFRDSSITHTLSNLGNKLDNIYSVVSPDTLILSTIRPFEDGLDFVTSVQRSNAMDTGDYIQGGFFGASHFPSSKNGDGSVGTAPNHCFIHRWKASSD
jgi:hypothetical protein